MVDISIQLSSTVKQVEDALGKKFRGRVAFGASRGLEKTVRRAQQTAAKSASIFLDRPTPNLTKQAGPRGGTRGWIRFTFPNKRDVLQSFAGGRSLNASVFIIDPLVEELHPNVFGGVVRNVPETSRRVITPTKHIINEDTRGGRLRKLNKYGNIPSLRRKIFSQLRDDPRYLFVHPRKKTKQTQHLPAGVYLKIKTKTTKRGRRGRALETDTTRVGRRSGYSLVMLFSYDVLRHYKKSWPFDRIVRQHFDHTAHLNIADAVRDAIAEGIEFDKKRGARG